MRCVLFTVTALAAAPAAAGGPSVTTRAVEVRVESVESLPQIAGRQARAGYEFVIVDTTWKNIIPLKPVPKKPDASGLSGFGSARKPGPADVTMEPTAYLVPTLTRHFWLLTDDRFADPVDFEAHGATSGHMPHDGFAIAKVDDRLRGKFVFQAPVNAKYRAFQFYDTVHGHVLIPLSGTKPAGAPAPLTAARENSFLQLAVTEAGFAPGAALPPGLRRYVLGLRGVSRSPTDIVDVPFQYLFGLTDEGCVARPETSAPGLSRPFDAVGSFLPDAPNEGQLSFLVPETTKLVQVQLRSVNGGPIDLAPAADFAAKWPTPVHTFVDGNVMRVHLLPRPARPAALEAPGQGVRQVLLDIAVENLSSRSGIEFQPVQLRLATDGGDFIDPSPQSATVPCRLDSEGLIPAGGVRRFMLVYEVHGGGAARVHYRGFELQEETAALP
jgi:hypothetical protein